MSKQEKPWKGICCKRCWFAKYDKCTCMCNHLNHGKGRKLQEEAEKEKEEDVNRS